MQVIMHFATPFWTSRDLAGNNQWIGSLPLEDPNTVQWNEFFSLHKATKQNVLVAFQAGNSAIAAEKLSDTETVNSVMTALKQMFGVSQLPDPTRYVITRWAQDPYAFGSYSFVAVGATDSMRNTLCKTAGRLFFAGEACSTAYPSTVQGAWLTGQAAARSLVSALRNAGAGK
jgi:monoamine oxidase